MFSGRAYDFRTDEAAGYFFGIQAHMALVYQHHAAATLVFKRYFANDKFVGLILRGNLRVFQTDKANLRISKHHADGAAAQTAADIRVTACIVTGNLALVGSFMQQRQLVGRIARDEDMRNAGLHGQRSDGGLRLPAYIRQQIHLFRRPAPNGLLHCRPHQV